ncbi:MAG: hypothetical protein V3V22_07545 [Methylococcales bacterium]
MKILLMLLVLFPSYCLSKDVFYQKYQFTIPDDYRVFDHRPFLKNDESVYIVNHNKKLMMVLRIDKTFVLDEYAVKSYRNLFYLLFGGESTNNKAVLEFRQFNARNHLQSFEISKINDFVFFRTNNVSNAIGETVFLVSTPLDDEALHIYFTAKANEALIQSIIDSLMVSLNVK